MKLPAITNDQAVIAWNSMRDHGSYDTSELVLDYLGDDDDDELFSDIEIMDLMDELFEIKEKYAGSRKKNEGGVIDAAIVEPIHRMLAPVARPFQLSQLGFWRWLSNIAGGGTFWNFIRWRFESEQQVNWGITSPGSIIEVYFYRAWLRGQKMFDADLSDPYHYAKVGSSDVWRSHILRQDFGRDREFVKAFLDTIYDPNGSTLIGTSELRTKVIPALRAWTSSASFSHLSYDENLALIQRLRNEAI